jgi:nucleotide-binding universal stress UspA family protein
MGAMPSPRLLVQRLLRPSNTMFDKVLVAADFSTDADAALAVAIDLARERHATLDIVHAYTPDTYVLPPPLDLVGLPPGPSSLTHVEQALEVRATHARKAGLIVTTQTLMGTPHAVLVDHAKETDVDVIVIGSRGLGAIAHALLGSVAEKVVRHAPCPVLVVPRAEAHRAMARGEKVARPAG